MVGMMACKVVVQALYFQSFTSDLLPYLCPRLLGVDRQASYEEVQEARNYLFEVRRGSAWGRGLALVVSTRRFLTWTQHARHQGGHASAARCHADPQASRAIQGVHRARPGLHPHREDEVAAQARLPAAAAGPQDRRPRRRGMSSVGFAQG